MNTSSDSLFLQYLCCSDDHSSATAGRLTERKLFVFIYNIRQCQSCSYQTDMVRREKLSGIFISADAFHIDFTQHITKPFFIGKYQHSSHFSHFHPFFFAVFVHRCKILFFPLLPQIIVKYLHTVADRQCNALNPISKHHLRSIFSRHLLDAGCYLFFRKTTPFHDNTFQELLPVHCFINHFSLLFF